MKPLKKPKISPDQLKKQAESVSNYYSELSDMVFANFLKHLTAGDMSQWNSKNIQEWKLQKLAETLQINKENQSLIAKYFKMSEKQLNSLIVKQGKTTYQDALKNMPEGYQKASRVLDQLDSLLDQAKGRIENLTKQTILDTSIHSGSLNQTAFDQYRSVINDTVTKVATGNLSVGQAIQETVSKWINTGTVGYLTDSAGKQWSLDNYARMTVTSTAFKTYNQMREQPAIDNGVHLFYMSEHDAPRPACEEIQGKVVYDPRTGELTDEEADYDAPNLADYGLGDPGGTMGVNCHHYLTPFVVGVNSDPSAEDEAESEEDDLNSDDEDYGDDNG